MAKRRITREGVRAFLEELACRERAPGTVENYRRAVAGFAAWLDGDEVEEDSVARWKGELLQQGYQPRTVNAMLAGIHAFFRCMGWQGCETKTLKLQRRLFREPGRELSRGEYQRLLDTAQAQGKARLALVMEAICATGIRVSEVKYLTVEAAQRGRAEVALKGKIRTILIPGKLARKLLKYAKGQKITTGEIFLTSGRKPLSRRQIWAEMKALCRSAGVEESKVFPHNLRHLFAQCFYRATRDIAKLADVLGHSCMETTRIYLISTGAEHCRQLERLGLLS